MKVETIGMDKKNVPELRFPEFVGEWRKFRLGDIALKIGSGSTPRGGSAAYQAEGIIFIRSQNVNNNLLQQEDVVFISDATNNKMTSTKVNPRDVLLNITGASIGRSCVVPQDFLIGNINQHVCIIRLNEEHSPYFLQPFISSRRGQKLIYQEQAGGGREGLNFVSINRFKLNFPSLPEQQKIAAFFTAIDQKISQLKRKRALLEQYKKGVMQKIFSQEIRFKDENGHEFPQWEKKRLGELTTKTGKKNKDNIRFPIYSINNREGFIPQEDQFDGLDSNTRGYDISMYKIIEERTFAYNPARINVGSIGYSGGLHSVIISSLYVCFKTHVDLEDSFLLQFLKTYQFRKSVLQNVEGGVRDYLFYENFSNIRIHLPSNEEQLIISKSLSLLDKKIVHMQSQVERAERWKKGLLQKMFV